MRDMMKILTALALGVMLLPAHGQKSDAALSAMRTPELAISYDLIGSNAPAGQCGCFVLNGGSATAAYPLPHRLSVVGQLTASHAGNIGSRKYDLTLVTYTFGFRYTPELKSKHISLFAQGLIGGSHAAGDLVSDNNPGQANASASLAGSVGGGMDVRWKSRISIRALEVSYQPTTVDNRTTSLENNYRISAGIIFHFSHR
jgi:outer membrane immunogenic protein